MIKCPTCKQEIPENDFNVSKDLAYCRTCKQNFSYSDLIVSSEYDAIDLNNPTKHITIRESWGGATLRHHRINPIVIFFIFFTAIWGGGSMTGMVVMIMEKGLSFETLFFLPFFLGTIGLIFLTLYMLFGKVEITEKNGDIEIFSGVFGVGIHRRTDLKNVRSVEIAYSNISQNHTRLTEVHINLKEGKKIKFGAGMTDESKAFIVAYLRKMLKL